MVFTYDIAQLNTSSLMQVRSLIGDTQSADPLLADEEITLRLPGAVLGQANIWAAAAVCCEDIAARYARQVDNAIGHVRLFLSQRATAYQTRAQMLRRRAAIEGGVAPYLGGESLSDKQTNEENTDRREPFFTVTEGDDEGGASGTLTGDELGPGWPWGA